MPQTTYRKLHLAAGSAPDTTPLLIDFNPPALRFDVTIFDNSALLAFSDDGIWFSSEIEFPAGVIASLDQVVRQVKIRNKTALSVARYNMRGYHNPVEVVGDPYVRVP